MSKGDEPGIGARMQYSGWVRIAWFLMALMPGPAFPQGRADALRACLTEFDGIEWRLPYQPPLRINNCSNSGRRSLEFIGNPTLGDEDDGSSDEGFAAAQSIVFNHFERLFLRRGYRRAVVEYGNARTESDPYTQCLLRGGGRRTPCRPEDYPARPSKPPIPFVSHARYVRQAPDGELVLTFATEARNTWRVTLESVSAAKATDGTR